MIFSGWQRVDVAANLRTAAGEEMGAGRTSADWDIGVGECVQIAKVASGERTGEPDGWQPSVALQEGFIFETIVEYMLAGMSFDEAADLAFKRYLMGLRAGVCKQLRLVKDRIRGTPDALNPAVPELESYKATRRTLRRALTQEDFENNYWTWLMGDKAYCYMAGIPQVRYFVWWIAGDYSKGRGTGAEVLTATCRFDDDELESNWKGVKAHADRKRGTIGGAGA